MPIAKGPFGLPLIALDPVTEAAAQRVERSGHCACLASRTKRGTPGVPSLHVDTQDISSPGWTALLKLVAEASAKHAKIFEPSASLAADQWSSVITLPQSVGALAAVEQVRLYGSHLRRLPPQVGRLEALEDLDIYTSYSLHWLPYEVMRCSRLRETRMSTRALYGNSKTRLPFPRLAGAIEVLMPETCSVCDQAFGEDEPQVFWTTQRIGTDIVPLLIHGCSAACVALVPDSPKGYYARPHKGGGGVGMPDADWTDRCPT